MKSLLHAWNEFFFAERSPLPLGLFRIAYGLCVTATLLLLKGDWLAWYGAHAWVSLNTMRVVESGARINLFTLIPQNDRLIAAFFWVFLASALMLTVGFFSRINSVLVYFFLTSIDQRNLFITHSGDTFLRVAGFFLMFAPVGAALSIDRMFRVRRGQEPPEIQPRRQWAVRLIQIELSLVYLATFCWKLKGSAWLDGSALFYIYHLLEFQRFPVPSWLLQPAFLKIATWFALFLELSLGTIIWIRRFRYKLLLAGLILHLSLEYSLNTPMMQWDFLSAYLLFLDGHDLQRAWVTLGTRVPLLRQIRP
jgi:hypothetical protein